MPSLLPLSIVYELGSGTYNIYRNDLETKVIQRLKYAVFGITGMLNNLITLDMIFISPTMIVIAMICTIKIRFWEAFSGSFSRCTTVNEEFDFKLAISLREQLQARS